MTRLTVHVLLLAQVKVAARARRAAAAVPAMPARADPVTDLEDMLSRAHRDDISNDLVAGHAREARREELVADVVVAI